MPSTPNYNIPYPLGTDKPLMANHMAAIATQVDAFIMSIPVGASFEWDYGAAQIPAWALLQYGQAVSRTTYAALAALASAASYPHGSGDGSTTFNIADKRGRVAAGKDDMGGTAANRITAAISGTAGTVLGAAVGTEGVTLATAQIPSHSHTGATGTFSADHSHSGTSGGRSAAHTHALNALTYAFGSDTQWSDYNGVNHFINNNAGMGTESADHSHGTTTGGSSANHTHGISAE